MNEYDVERRLHLVFSTLLGDISLQGKRILEVGAGTGRFSKMIRERGAELTVLDIGESLVKKLTTRLECPGTVGDACHLPFQSNVFDLVISSECIEHTMHPFQALLEMCRVVKDGGGVCVTTPNKLWFPVLLMARILGIRKFSGLENWIFPVTATRLFRNQGMVVRHISGCHLWPFQFSLSQPVLRRLDGLGHALYPVMINFGIFCEKVDPGP